MIMLRQRRRKGLQRSSRLSSDELSAALSLKRQAIIRSGTDGSFDKEGVQSAYASQFSLTYDAIALDYDGTLISLASRGSSPSLSLLRTIGKILDYGLPVVIISGRGDSLLELNKSLSGFSQDSLFLAMYNGSKITRGSQSEIICDHKIGLKRLFASIRNNSSLGKDIQRCGLKDYAIQILPRKKSKGFMDALCERMKVILPPPFVARNSGFALDIYPIARTKDHSLKAISEFAGTKMRFLRIGDQGHEFGNDYELLHSKGGFSVGTISADPYFCFPVLDFKGKRLQGPTGAKVLLSDIFRQS